MAQWHGVTISEWRKRLQDLVKLGGAAPQPLFAPLIFAAAAAVEAVSPGMMAQSGTRIRKNLVELRKILGTPVVTSAVPSGLEAESLGVGFELAHWPPLQSDALCLRLPEDFDPGLLDLGKRLGAAVDAIKQLKAGAEAPLIAAALTGPATLLQQLRRAGFDCDGETGYAFVAQALATILRHMAEAGCEIVQFCEQAPVPEEDRQDWSDALATVAKVCRFHRVPPLLTLGDGVSQTWPAHVIACPLQRQQMSSAAPALCRAIDPDPHTWAAEFGDAGAVHMLVTREDLRADVDIGQLRLALAGME